MQPPQRTLTANIASPVRRHPTISGCSIAKTDLHFSDGSRVFLEAWTAAHDVCDHRGRAVGALVAITTDGHGTSVRIQMTRDGQRFGASRRATRCRTLAEARGVASAKLIAHRKAALRKFQLTAVLGYGGES
jgi:hypothetical protein